MKKSALIIGTSSYQNQLFDPLKAPGQDAKLLAKVLGDASIGGFEVQMLLNKPSFTISKEIESFFAETKRDDLLLLYLSCHGIKDENGLLYFAAINTHPKLLRSTAISAYFVNEIMRHSLSRQQVLILDCCFSGAFAKGMVARASAQIGSGEHFEGRGRVVLTGSDAMQYTFEGDRFDGNGISSIFTRTIVEGLRSGKADRNDDGLITIDELYSYVYDTITEQTRNQTPKKWEFDVHGTIVIARNPEAERRAAEKAELERKAKEKTEQEQQARDHQEPPKRQPLRTRWAIIIAIIIIAVGVGLWITNHRQISDTQQSANNPIPVVSDASVNTHPSPIGEGDESLRRQRALDIIKQYFRFDQIEPEKIVWFDFTSHGNKIEFYSIYRHGSSRYLDVFTTRRSVENLYHERIDPLVEQNLTADHVRLNGTEFFVVSSTGGSGGFLGFEMYTYDGIGKLHRAYESGSLFQGSLIADSDRLYLYTAGERYEFKYIRKTVKRVPYTERLSYKSLPGTHVLTVNVVDEQLAIKYDGNPIVFVPDSAPTRQMVSVGYITVKQDEQIVIDDTQAAGHGHIRTLADSGVLTFAPGFFEALKPAKPGEGDVLFEYKYEVGYKVRVRVE